MERETSEVEVDPPVITGTEVSYDENANGTLRDPLLRTRSVQPETAKNRDKHKAIVGTYFAPIESLDYELIENELFRQDWRSRTKGEILEYVVVKWSFVFLVGLLTGLVGFGINMAVENIAGRKLHWTSERIREGRYWYAAIVYAGCNVGLVVCSALLVVYISPAAAGSGIPEVKGYLNGIDPPNIFSLKTFFVKVLGSVGSVSGGLIVGKEGPLVHIGSCIASIIGQGGSRKYHLTWKWLRYFKNDRDRRDLVTCGSAAGVATAFRAPLGGVLFALEEVTSWWRSPLLWRCFFTTAVVAVVLKTLMAWCADGNCGLFGEGGLIMFETRGGNTSDFGLRELFPIIVMGGIGGVLGSIFNQCNAKVVTIYSVWLSKKWRISKVLLAGAIALLTSICSFFVPFLGECRPCPEPKGAGSKECPATGLAANYKAFNCPPNQYNDLATLFFNTNDDATRNLFSTGTQGEYRTSSLMIYLACCYILALTTYGIAVPSGLFVPGILCGATYGRAAGMAMISVLGDSQLDEGIYAVLGSASFLGGSMRMTVSLCIVLLELTNNLPLLPLIMVVLLVSKTVGDSFNNAIFDLHVKLKGFPFLDAHPEPFMRHLLAADAITSPLVQLNVVEKVENIIDVLTNTKHNAFAVMDKDGAVFFGLVLRSHLMVLLEKGEFFTPETVPTTVMHFNSVDFAKSGSGHVKRIEQMHITPEQQDMLLDLRLVTNTSPYTVLETMSLAKAFTLFRQLGLRHLCVMSRAQQGPPIVGILTRHDFMPEYLHSIYPNVR